MKKLSLGILLGIISILSIYASSDIGYPLIDLTTHLVGDDVATDEERPRSLVSVPVVYQNNNTIIFANTGWCNSITIIDVNTEEIVYENTINKSTTHITLPTYLKGDYEIRFNCDIYYYSGIIEL
jgi:hypothetical protein